MKTYPIKYALVTLTLLTSTSIFSQKSIKVVEEVVNFKHGEHPGFVVNFPEVEFDKSTKEWIKEIEKGTKSKTALADGEYSLFGAQIDEISETPLNIYSTLIKNDSSVTLKAAFEIKPKEFVSREQSEKEAAQAEAFLFAFAKKQYVIAAKDQLKNKEKKLSSLERDLKNLRSNKEKLEKRIITENNKIIAANDEIAHLKHESEQINDKLGQERSKLLDISGEEAQKAQKVVIKETERSKNKTLREIKSKQKSIVDSNSTIDESKLNIQTNITAQAKKLSEIEMQKQVVSAATAKVETILTY